MFKTVKVTFEIETNMEPHQIKESLVWLINRGEIALENKPKDSADIDPTSIEVGLCPFTHNELKD